MAKRKSGRKNAANLKLWTVLCLALVLIAGIALRGIIVYKLYPLKHEEYISSISEEYSLNKYFVSAVICTESSFDENAVSRQGAVGLMQIMPETGGWIAGHMGIDDYSESMLYDPETNIKFGCWYLSYLMKRFSGDYRKVLAAYNAGPAKVEQWLEEDSELDNIPYEETENYLKKVMRNYEIYKGLYKDF